MADKPHEKRVTIKALEPLRTADGKRVAVGKTTEVTESTAKILVDKKQAEILTQAKG